MNHFPLVHEQFVEVLTCVTFSNSSIIFWHVLTSWIQQNRLPYGHLSLAFISTALDLGYKSFNSSKFRSHISSFNQRTKKLQILESCRVLFAACNEANQKPNMMYNCFFLLIGAMVGVGDFTAMHVVAIAALTGFVPQTHCDFNTYGSRTRKPKQL